MDKDRIAHGNRDGPDMERPNRGRLSWRDVYRNNDTAIIRVLCYEYVTHGGVTEKMERLIAWRAGV